MSRAKCKGLLTVLVFLSGCQAEPELLHPGGPHGQTPAATQIEGGTRTRADDAGSARPIPTIAAQDAGTPDKPPTADAGPSPPPALPTIHVALKNASGRTIWHGGPSGCSDRWAALHPAHGVPASALETKALTEARNELGCICTCSTLGASEVCHREKCPEMFGCTAAFWSAPIASGTTLEGDVTPFTTQFDIDRKCLARVAYPARTEMIATFCYQLSESSLEDHCVDVPFRMGDSSVTYVVEDVPDDAGI